LRRAARFALAAAALAACAPSDFDRFQVTDLSAAVDSLPPPDLAGRDLTGVDLAGRDLAGVDLASVDLARADLAGSTDLNPCDAAQCSPWTTMTCGQCGTRTCSTACTFNACTPDSALCSCIVATDTCCYWPTCKLNNVACTSGSECCSGICSGAGTCACAPAGTLLNFAAILRGPYICCSGGSGSTATPCQFQCN
jgi:hypothetical protein